jgi:uncharacterized protein with HEPN domain
MQEADRVRIKHMLDAVYEISNFTQEITKVEFEKDRKLHLSVVRLLEIIGEAASKVSPEIQSEYNQIPWIGEAASKVSPEIQSEYNQIPWYSIIGMRNRLIHGYLDIDLDIVWETIKTDIPDLINDLEKIIKK